MRIDVLRKIPEDPDLRQKWNAVALQVERPQVFFTYEWALAVSCAYHASLHPLLFLAYDDQNSLIGVAALATDPGHQRASFLCATTGDYCDFLSVSELRADFVSAVLGESKKLGVRSFALTNLPADSPTIAALGPAARQSHLSCHMRTAYVCAQVQIDTLERRGLNQPALPRKKMLRRFLNAMGRENPVRLEHGRTWDSIEPLLPEFMQAHVARFLVTGRISNMARRERRVFLGELAKLLSDSGWMALTRMMSGERVFAWNYGFQYQGTWFWYQPTFDSELEKYSPGFCLLAKLVEDAAGNPECKWVDLGLGAEEYKERFANGTRETRYVSLQSSTMDHCWDVARDRAARFAKSSPRSEAMIRSVVSRVRQAQNSIQRLGTMGVVKAASNKVRSHIWTDQEIFVYEGKRAVLSDSSETTIRPLDLNLLAAAAIAYVDDGETLAYLLRAARKLRQKEAKGFALIDREGIPLHLAWLRPMDGSMAAGLDREFAAIFCEGLLVEDCWTPVLHRGKDYCARTLERVANDLRQRATSIWALSSPENSAWTRALHKAGFQLRYSLQKWLFWRHLVTPRASTGNEITVGQASVRS